MSDYVIAVDGLASLSDIENLDEDILTAARQAINAATKRARTQADRDIRKQVNFLATYLRGKLTIKKMASGRNLEGVIRGTDRPTSLARFAKQRDPQKTRKAGGIDVEVEPGQSKFMKGAFLMRLNNNNLGLAIRLKDGETVRNKRTVTKIGKGLYLLYGPSVNQVFRGVAEDSLGDIADYLETEFTRLLDLK